MDSSRRYVSPVLTDAPSFLPTARRLLVAAGFERVPGTTPVLFNGGTDELIWMIMPERDRWGPHYRIEIGCVRRSILDGATPTYTASEFMIAYEALGAAVPPSASGTRFADHRSYFTMAFDFGHAALSPEARSEALQFAVDEIRCFVDANPTVKALGRTLRAQGIEDCIITRALREAMDANGRDQRDDGPTDR